MAGTRSFKPRLDEHEFLATLANTGDRERLLRQPIGDNAIVQGRLAQEPDFPIRSSAPRQPAVAVGTQNFRPQATSVREPAGVLSMLEGGSWNEFSCSYCRWGWGCRLLVKRAWRAV